jgi:plastocyanin
MTALLLFALVGRVWTGEQPAPRPILLLEPAGAARTAPSPRAAHLDEVWLSFVPKVQVVPPGSTLVFRARDADSHTVHAWYGGRTLFNQASVPHGPEQQVVLEQPGVVSVTCDVHAEMRAWVLVSDSPFAAVGDVDGTFHADVPPGRYRLAVWLPGDGAPTPIGERQVGSAPLELRLPARAHAPVEVTAQAPAPATTEPPPRLPSWLHGPKKSWPRGNAAYALSVVGAPVGFALAWLIFAGGARRRWSLATCILLGCALAFALGALSAAGLSPAVATGLGFGAFLGTVLVGAGRVGSG